MFLIKIKPHVADKELDYRAVINDAQYPGNDGASDRRLLLC